MSANSIAKRLRERAETARILETEADSPKEKRAMRQLAEHYEVWANRLEPDDNAAASAIGTDLAALPPA
jgi:hypothetical protein